VKKWTEHFRDLLNRQPPQLTADITIAPNPLEINCNPLTKMEIRKAIKALKGGKAEAPDRIPADALKANTENLHQHVSPSHENHLGGRKCPI